MIFDTLKSAVLCYFITQINYVSFIGRYSNLAIFFFSIRVFFHDHPQITGPQGKGEGIYLTPHYHFHLLQKHLDISRAVTAESSPLHLVSECKSLTIFSHIPNFQSDKSMPETNILNYRTFLFKMLFTVKSFFYSS